MPRTLLLMRHAKSSWNDPALSDFDRQLNNRGRKAALRVGNHIRDMGLVPDLVLCSTAKRAVETWNLVKEALGGDIDVKLLKGLYLASPSQLCRAIHTVPSHNDPLLVIAHNPGIQELASLLAGDPKDERTRVLMNAMRTKFPTAALAILTLNTSSWSDMAYGQAHLEDFICPRDLR
jgi:phosphohistidine phosphatase